MPATSAASSSRARLRRALASAALASAALLSLATLAAPADGKTRPLRTGISYLYVKDAEPVAFQHARAAGASLVLTPLEWGWIVPDERPGDWDPRNPGDPHYYWDDYDDWVANAVAAGLTPVIQVRGAPRWAQQCGFTGFDSPCDTDPGDLADFTTAVVRRYSGDFEGLPRVRFWQGLNEPNLSLFFRPQFVDGRAVSADLYRNLLNTFHDAVKAVDPSNLVLAAGLGPNAVPGHTIGPMQFTRELLCMRGAARPRPTRGNCGGGVRFDIYDIHPYTTGSPSHEGRINDVQMGDLRKLRGLLAAADRAGRIHGAFRRTPLWITEVSWDSRPPDPGGLPPRILNRWTAEALFTAWRSGVSTLFWFSLRDFERDFDLEAYESPESGLYYRGETIAEDRPKSNLYAFRFPLVSYPRQRGLFYWGRTSSSGPGKVRIQVRQKGRWRQVAVARADRNGIFRGLARTRYGRNRKGLVRAVHAGQRSVPFSMTPIGDFFHPPFGSPVN